MKHRLPAIGATRGFAIDGAFMVIEQVATMSLEPPKAEKKTRRPVQTELIPIEPRPTPRTTEIQNLLTKIHEGRS